MRPKNFSSIGNILTRQVTAGKLYKTKRPIKSIAIHCSASPQNRGDDARTIDKWHLDNGWSGLGYHYVILPDGTIQKGRWVDAEGAGVYKHNRNTIHICFIGGMKYDDITPQQVKAIKELGSLLVSMYKLTPKDIKGHNEYKGHHSRGCPMTEKFRLS